MVSQSYNGPDLARNKAESRWIESPVSSDNATRRVALFKRVASPQIVNGSICCGNCAEDRKAPGSRPVDSCRAALVQNRGLGEFRYLRYQDRGAHCGPGLSVSVWGAGYSSFNEILFRISGCGVGGFRRFALCSGLYDLWWLPEPGRHHAEFRGERGGQYSWASEG